MAERIIYETPAAPHPQAGEQEGHQGTIGSILLLATLLLVIAVFGASSSKAGAALFGFLGLGALGTGYLYYRTVRQKSRDWKQLAATLPQRKVVEEDLGGQLELRVLKDGIEVKELKLPDSEEQDQLRLKLIEEVWKADNQDLTAIIETYESKISARKESLHKDTRLDLSGYPAPQELEALLEQELGSTELDDLYFLEDPTPPYLKEVADLQKKGALLTLAMFMPLIAIAFALISDISALEIVEVWFFMLSIPVAAIALFRAHRDPHKQTLSQVREIWEKLLETSPSWEIVSKSAGELVEISLWEYHDDKELKLESGTFRAEDYDNQDTYKDKLEAKIMKLQAEELKRLEPIYLQKTQTLIAERESRAD